MLALKALITLKRLPLGHLTKVRDLDAFDGPLLTQFRHDRGDHYLYYWCDCDDRTNRWMVLRVSETNIVRLVNRIIPLEFVIPNGGQDSFVYFADIDSAGKTTGVFMVDALAVPEDYTPGQGSYLETEIDRNENSYALIIEDALSLGDIIDLPTKYSQAYAFQYTCDVLQPQSLEDFPWRGGFSSMHFYHSLIERIPHEGKPSIASVQYSSPGFIRFRVHRETARRVAKSIVAFSDDSKAGDNRSKSGVAEASRSLIRYISGNRLNDLRRDNSDYASKEWVRHVPILGTKTEALMRELGLDGEMFLRIAPSNFVAAKAALSFVIRLKRLAKLQDSGVVRFPHE